MRMVCSYLIGSANNKELLVKAGIERAKGFIAVVGTDADNVFLTLIARQLKPEAENYRPGHYE